MIIVTPIVRYSVLCVCGTLMIHSQALNTSKARLFAPHMRLESTGLSLFVFCVLPSLRVCVCDFVSCVCSHVPSQPGHTGSRCASRRQCNRGVHACSLLSVCVLPCFTARQSKPMRPISKTMRQRPTPQAASGLLQSTTGRQAGRLTHLTAVTTLLLGTT